MIIGILQVELYIGDAMSLKDKRRVVHSVKDRLSRDHLVAVAEVDALDVHRRAVLGIVTVSNSTPHTQGTMSRIVNQLRNEKRFVLNDHQTEILQGH